MASAEDNIRRAREACTNPDPCEWCGNGPTCRQVVIPAEWHEGVCKRRAVEADGCFDCWRRMGRLPGYAVRASESVQMTREVAAWRRKRARDEMQQNQCVLFESTAPKPTGATEGIE